MKENKDRDQFVMRALLALQTAMDDRNYPEAEVIVDALVEEVRRTEHAIPMVRP